jgi:hypothetical protein
MMTEHTEDARRGLLSIFSDAWKELHGFRPRGILFPHDASYEEIEEELVSLELQAREEEEEEKEEPSLFEIFYGEELA